MTILDQQYLLWVTFNSEILVRYWMKRSSLYLFLFRRPASYLLLKHRRMYWQKAHETKYPFFQISTEDKQNLLGDIEVEWNGDRFNNFANLKRSEETLDLIYKLKTPKFAEKRFLVTEIKYKSLGDRHNLTWV